MTSCSPPALGFSGAQPSSVFLPRGVTKHWYSYFSFLGFVTVCLWVSLILATLYGEPAGNHDQYCFYGE